MLKTKGNRGLLVTAMVAALALGGCGDSGSTADSSPSATPEPAATAAPAPAAAKSKVRTDFDQAAAATLYADNCAACHQPKGEGIDGVYPGFHDNVLVKGPTGDLLRVILEGRGGMPSFLEDMTPAEIALVANHMRNEWTDQTDLITADQVGEIAGGLNKASGDARKDD